MQRIHQAFLLTALLLAVALAGCGKPTATPSTEGPYRVDEALPAEEHFKKGNEFAQAGEFDKAIAEYQAVLKAEPNNTSALTNLGVVYYSLGNLDQAIAQYQKAIQIAPNDADIHSNLAAAYVQKAQMGQAQPDRSLLDKALQEYQTAVQLKPDLAEAYFGLGVIYVTLGENDRAIAAFEKFQQVDKGTDKIATEQAAQYLKQLKGP